MFQILQDDTIMIEESKLCQGKRDPMLLLIQLILGRIPVKIRSLFHIFMIHQEGSSVNMKIWLDIWFCKP